MRTGSDRGAPAGLHGEGRLVVAARDFAPAYLKTHAEGRLRNKVEEAREVLHSCAACPRACGVNRLESKTGVCRVGWRARVSSAFPHLGEENCLRGRRGSGTIFFSGCNLGCVFCQNFD